VDELDASVSLHEAGALPRELAAHAVVGGGPMMVRSVTGMSQRMPKTARSPLLSSRVNASISPPAAIAALRAVLRPMLVLFLVAFAPR